MPVDRSVIRSAGLRGFRQVVAGLGGAPDSCARRAGLDPAALDEDDLLVRGVEVATALEIAATELDCPDLGLRISAYQDLSMLGLLSLAIANSPTVADAMDCTSRYLFVHAPVLSIATVSDPYGVPGVDAVRYDTTPPGVPAPVQGTDLGLAFVHRATLVLAGGSYGLRTVELPYVPPAPLSVYEEFFGVPVRTGSEAAMLRMPSSLGRLPVAGTDEGVRRMALEYLDAQAPPGQSVTTRVRGAITQTLGTSGAEIGPVAGLLAVHPRTLQRRLAEEGTGFAEVLDDVRRTAAHRYLTGTDLPLTQVAGLLGLSEQSALSRSCRRWWGATPSDVRRGAA